MFVEHVFGRDLRYGAARGPGWYPLWHKRTMQQTSSQVDRLTHHVRGKKRSGPISRVLSWTAIYLRLTSPPGSSALPERGAGHTMALLHALAPEGACQAAVLPRRWWSLTPPFQLFSHPPRRAAGVFFSAALSVGSPRQAVNLLPALWSPDFPHDVARTPRGRLVHFARTIVARPHPGMPLWRKAASFVDNSPGA